MNFGFVTCVQLGLSCLEEIYRIGGSVHLIITLKDDISRGKSGRIYLDSFCQKHNIDLIKCNNINDQDVINAIKSHNIDWLFIIGWSQIAGENIINCPKYGALGIHPTLLPVGRGRAPIPWPIIKGLTKTGVTLFKLDEGVDTGPILQQIVLPIDIDETATSLYRKVTDAHRELISNVWNDLESNNIQLIPQDEKRATIWPARKPEDGEINRTMSCTSADRLVRGVTKPYPGAFVIDRGIRYTIWSAEFINGYECNCHSFSINNESLQFQLSDGCLVSKDWVVN